MCLVRRWDGKMASRKGSGSCRQSNMKSSAYWSASLAGDRKYAGQEWLASTVTNLGDVAHPESRALLGWAPEQFKSARMPSIQS